MTSPPPTRGAAPRFRCRACGRTLTAAQAVLEHCRDVYAARPAICRGVLVQIEGGAITPAVVEAAIERGVALLDFGADDRAGVTLPIGLQPVGRDQLVPGGAGGSDEGGDRRHKDSIATARAERTANRCAADSHAFGGVEP